MACYIFGAGDFDGLEERPGAEDYVIAADGGYTACRRAGVEPQLLLGISIRWRRYRRCPMWSGCRWRRTTRT